MKKKNVFHFFFFMMVGVVYTLRSLKYKWALDTTLLDIKRYDMGLWKVA